MTKFNHNRDIEDFKIELDIIISAGYTPIAVSQMYMENVFVFKTEEEANNAYNILEIIEKKLCGWWYGSEQFLKELNEYEESFNNEIKVLVHWL